MRPAVIATLSPDRARLACSMKSRLITESLRSERSSSNSIVLRRERAEITNRGGDIKSSRSRRRLSQSTRSALGTQRRQCRSAKTAVKQQGATRRTKSERASFFSPDPPRQELNYGFRRGWVIFRGEMAQKHVKNGGVGASLLGVMDAVLDVLRFVLKSRMPRIRFLGDA